MFVIRIGLSKQIKLFFKWNVLSACFIVCNITTHVTVIIYLKVQEDIYVAVEAKRTHDVANTFTLMKHKHIHVVRCE